MQVMAIWCVHNALLKSGTSSGSFSGYSKSYSFSTGKKLFSYEQIHKNIVKYQIPLSNPLMVMMLLGMVYLP